MENKEKERAKKIWDKISNEMTKEKLYSILNKSKELFDISSSTHLAQFSNKIKLIFEMIKDYTKGNYKNIPWKTISALSATLLYILMPLDAIPDIIPLAGLIDDDFIISLCIKFFSEDIEKYKVWKEETTGNVFDNNTDDIDDILE